VIRDVRFDGRVVESRLVVVGLVLVSAVLHAGWNAIAHAARDRAVGFALIGLASAVVGAVLVAVGAGLSSAHLGLAATSAVLHTGYLTLLLASYRHGDFSRAYPLARGTGVAVVAVASVFLPGSPLGPGVALGAGLVVLGLAGVTLAGPRLTRRDRPGLLAALATGVTIAAYTMVDGVAVAGGAEVASYAGWTFLLYGVVLPAVLVARRRRAVVRLPAREVLTGLAGGLVSVAAYGLVLLAQTSGALAAVAALRESSIAFGVLIGALLLREPAARARLAPALVVTAGAAVLALVP